ncbi:Rho1 guanine nucleotide exchange factor 1 [Choanephora cucurbitarum]|uniref:Rho1 guanine nucleotide exchange factor 1 n=1 Tax=Choanephora cucurbitarum TaxID=101091 RepID=A0A1C7NMI1_9FUNG|nr:Rho1 guanine nucleotide exchange factor 1 [Choanephora cucurbitarum]
MEHEYTSTTPLEHIKSPTLEALCHDLDMFINELNVNRSQESISTLSNKKYGKDIAPLELSRPVTQDPHVHRDSFSDCRTESESFNYTPAVDNYASFSDYASPPIMSPTNTIPTVHRNISPSSSTTSTKTNQTPPMSPSYLRVSSNTPDDHLLTTRSSSLNRAMSTSSGKSVVQRSPFSPNNKQQFFSHPTSPLATEIRSAHHHVEIEIPNHALLSYMARELIREVAFLNERRRIYCSVEYPLSFTGEEVMEIIRGFSLPGLGDRLYLDIAQTLMYCKPSLIVPIDSSEKSIRKNKVYDSPTEMYTLVESSLDKQIHGVYTPLTRCYSMSCLPGQPGCYSASCPNKVYSLNGTIFKKPAKSVLSSSSHDTTLSRAWSATVSKEILKSMPDHEIKRQEAIHEIIYTEEDYVRDLKILDVDFAQELLASQCIEEGRKQAFHDKVLNNYKEILAIHDALYKDLRDYQASCQANDEAGIVDKIGNIFLRHIPFFMDAYMRYGPHVVLAEYEAKLEAERNMVFKHFIKAREQLAQCRRLPFRHFIILPVTRLQRYSLLLDAALKKTPDDHPDKEYLAECIDMIKNVAEKVDEGTSITKNTLRIYEINSRIRYKPDEYHELGLLHPGRRLLKEGVLTRRSHMVVETIELQVFLFDHLLLFTKVKKAPNKENDVEYVISKKPIPMALLHLQEATEGFSIGLRNMNSTYSATQTTNPLLSPGNNGASGSPFGSSYPILISHLGRHGADYMLYAENAAVRADWKDKIVQAKAKKEMEEMDKQVFEIRSLSDTTFAGTNSGLQSHNHGKVICTVAFMGTTGIRMIAVGTSQGIWMGIEGDTNTIRHVLSISDVQQIAVLEDHHIFLVLADKTLYAYALDALVPKDSRKNQPDKPFQKIAQHITFFHSGVCNGRPIVVAMKKRGVDSHFKVLEPVCGDLRDPKNSKFFTKTGLFGKMHSWFKSTIEFYIGTESYAMHFLKARVVVVCARGFEIINLEALNMNRNLPDPTHPDFAFVRQRGEDLKPLGMFRCRDHYLLCYDQFAFMVNVHGALVRETPLIEWEGVPQSVAFYYPYVIGFDPRFIEIRHVETGELIQVLAGSHMRCLQFINHNIAPVIHGCMAHPFKPDYQYIFQLVGTFEPPL